MGHSSQMPCVCKDIEFVCGIKGLVIYIYVYIAVCCNVLQCVAVCCSVLQCVAVRCSVLQCVADCSVGLVMYICIYIYNHIQNIYIYFVCDVG